MFRLKVANIHRHSVFFATVSLFHKDTMCIYISINQLQNGINCTNLYTLRLVGWYTTNQGRVLLLFWFRFSKQCTQVFLHLTLNENEAKQTTLFSDSIVIYITLFITCFRYPFTILYNSEQYQYLFLI